MPIIGTPSFVAGSTYITATTYDVTVDVGSAADRGLLLIALFYGDPAVNGYVSIDGATFDPGGAAIAMTAGAQVNTSGSGGMFVPGTLRAFAASGLPSGSRTVRIAITPGTDGGIPFVWAIPLSDVTSIAAVTLDINGYVGTAPSINVASTAGGTVVAAIMSSDMEDAVTVTPTSPATVVQRVLTAQGGSILKGAILTRAAAASGTTTSVAATLSASRGIGELGWTVYGPADTTPPIITGPTGTSTGSTTAGGTVSTDEANGTLYRLASTNATETAATVKAAALTTSVTATGSQSVTFTGLAASTTYYAHYVHTDAAGNDSTRVSSASFTTAAPSDTTAPTLSSPAAAGGVNVCSGSVTTNEGNGTLYAVVCASATPPTALQVEAGQDNTGAAALRVVSQAVSTTGSQTIASGAITAGTRYAYYMHKDAAGNRSTVAASASFVVTAPVLAGLTSSPLKNNTGTLLVAVAWEAYVNNPTTGALVVKKTGLTSNGSGIVTFTDAALAAATSYSVRWRRTDTGAEGLETLTAA